MEHQTISGWYQDSVGIPYPSIASQPSYSYLPPGNIDAAGVITKKPVITTPGASNWVIPIVPNTNIQGSRVLRNASLSMALVSLQETGASGSGNFVEAAIEFYWAIRYIPSGSTPTQPGTQLNFAGSTPGLSLFADSQFTLASGMYLGNDRSINIAFPNSVVLQSGDSVVLAVWYNQAFPRDGSFNGNLEVALNAVMNYSINFK